METPWGRLCDLKIDDHDVAAQVISADKHQLVEGLVVECLFDQIVDKVALASSQDVVALDVESVIVDSRRTTDRWLAFVWVRTITAGLGRYLCALEQRFVPYLVSYDAGEFLACRVEGGKRVEQPRPLQDLMQELSGGPSSPFRVDASVKNLNRQRQAFWGFISAYYKNRLAERVVLPRILINCGIQPYFRSVWNLDRICLIANDLWLFEIKHKFPIDRQRLQFGINDGELALLGMLADAGIRCLHTILVKPIWSKDIGSMYLLNDLNMRTRAAVIGKVLDAAAIANVLGQQSGRSGAHTSITGLSGLSYKSFFATDFVKLGLLSDGALAIAGNMAAAMHRATVPRAEDQWLRSLRVQQQRETDDGERPGLSV